MEIDQNPGLKTFLINSFSAFPNISPLFTVQDAAIQKVKILDFPTRKDEEWKYSSPQSWLGKNFQFETEEKIFSQVQFDNFIVPGLEANNLVFVNGKYQRQLSNIISNPDELIIEPIESAVNKYPELLKTYLGSMADFKNNIFTAINTSQIKEGIFIHIPSGAKVNVPVVLYYISDNNGPIISNTRNLIVAGKGSESSLVEIYTGSQQSNDCFVNSVTEISVPENARVKYFKILNESNNNYHIGSTEVKQQRDSYFESTTINLGGAYIRNNLNLVMDGENCESHMFGLSISSENQLIDNHTLADHQKPNCYSNEIYKSILSDKSTGVFNGKIFVRKDAQKTNAFQSNKNIVLSQDATMNTKPQLEIFADDVKCSHGATVGQLDESMLFYMQARGIGKEKARRLLMQAFANEITDNILKGPFKNYLEDAIVGKLEK